MNNKLTILISASVGGAIGAGVTYLVLKKKTEEKISEEVNKFKESIEDLNSETSSKVSVIVDEVSVSPERSSQLMEAMKEADSLIDELGYGEAMLHPGPLSTVIVNDEDTTADDIRDAPPEIREELLEEAIDSSRTGPYVISNDEFHHDNEYYDKLTITYYECGTLADEADRPITDISFVIGDKALDHFGDRSDDPNTVYVRNDNAATDYEVMRHPNTFAHAVYGVQDDPVDPAERKNRAMKFRNDD